MKLIKKLSLLSIALLAFSCGDDNTNDGGSSLDGVITSTSDADYNANALQGDIKGNITIPAGEYILSGALVVKDGYTLTIDPGATFKAVPGGTNVYVAVEQGAKIEANGTEASPIRFTSNSDNPRSGDWGGILLMGKAPISNPAGSEGATAVTEVVNFTFGGSDVNDNSGVLSNVIVEYTGARINGDKEFNGFTFYGVGKGTKVNNIAALYGDDDALEFFGGTVDVTNVLVVNAKDDMLDWTQGFRGSITNAYCIREAGFNDVTSDPRGIEADGNPDGDFPNYVNQSNPTLTNITLITNSVVELSDMIKIRRGSSATITNVLMMLGANAPAPGDLIDLTDSKGYAADNGVIISGYATGANVDINDIKLDATETPIDIPAVKGSSISILSGATGGADTSKLAFSGYSF
ncbi:MAG: hypothetical protein H6604_01560 [Flavobacteriales bacterium]|nr:hypothetical protein [Flavobacteriales bacterium]